jgi:hypothetical protein
MRSPRWLAPLTLCCCADTLSPPPSVPAAAPTASSNPAARAETGARTLEDDLAFLRAHAPVDVLEAPGGGRVVLSATWQGRVLTSAVEPQGKSLGFLNRKFIEAGTTSTAFDNYGGEDRFWLGPEGGQYGLYFWPGAPFVIGSWQTPHAMQEGAWKVTGRDATHVTFARSMHVMNWSRTEFDVVIERTVQVLDAKEVQARFGDAPPANVKWVAFESVNRVTNAGARAWTRETGLLSIWILGMFNPSPDSRVVIPFETAARGPIVNDAYFGRVPPERLFVHPRDGWLAFVADGTHRCKIGLTPARARDTLGSYSPSSHLLTLVRYSKPLSAPNGYVNSMWSQQGDPFGGDAVNSYNDGPTQPGQPSLGGFYELETSSPAAALAPGEWIEHTHTTMHLVADPGSLEPIAKRVLGVSLAAITSQAGADPSR